MFKQNKKTNQQANKKSFYGNKTPYKKFFYHDVAQRKGKKINKYNFNKKNRNFCYGNLLPEASGFSLEEQVIFERLWKGALGQTYGNRLLAKQDKKSCCCHCQCGNPPGELNDRNHASQFGMLKNWTGDGVNKKTMKSVVR